MELREARAGYLVETEQRVPKGYKQTEVGVIPEDWSVVDYVSFGQIIDGDRGINYPSASELRDSGYCLFLNAGNVTKIGFRFADCQFISAEKDKKLNKGKLERGDVVLTTRGTIGNFAYFSEEIPFEQIRINSGMVVLRNMSATVDTAYQYLVLRSRIVVSQIERLTFGSAQPQLTVKGISSLKIPRPSTKAEQEAIAEALSDADALIESLEQLIAKKRQIKQGTMQELLTGKKRLPGFSGEWGETSLLELAAGKKELFDDGDWIESEHITNDGVRLIQTGNIGIGQFVEKEIKKYIFESSFVSLRCKELREGDLLICRLAEPAGRACVLPNIGEQKTVTSVDVTIFRPPSSTANRIFLANLFSTDRWFQEVSDRSGGTTHKRISRGALGRLKIKVPTLPEQTAIAAILTDMDAEIAALEEKLAKTRSIKQGMMHNLLTGRIRLL